MRGRHSLQTSDAVGAAQSQVGPNAQASIVYLNKRSGMSYGKIVDHLKEANGIDIKWVIRCGAPITWRKALLAEPKSSRGRSST